MSYQAVEAQKEAVIFSSWTVSLSFPILWSSFPLLTLKILNHYIEN